MRYLLSIIIPTKDRYVTLLPVIDSLILINSDELEIVIQDNSLNNLIILDYLKKVDDARIKYFHSNKQLSQTGNSDLAVENSLGEYICFIGDDDGVMPYIINVVKWMKEKRIEVLKTYKPDYYWPGMQPTSTSSEISGVLKFSRFSYNVKRIDCCNALSKALKRGGTDISPLASLYHGIVSKAILDKIKEASNSYFPGPSPDMANAVGLMLFTKYYYYFNFPLVISGKSINSIGGQGLLHNHINKIEEVKHLPHDTNVNWSKEIPKYWTGATIWAESLLKSLEKCGFETKKKQLNIPFLYASLILFHYNQKKNIFKGFHQSIYSFNFFVALIYLIYKRGTIFIKNRISFFGLIRYDKVLSISEAIKLLSENINYQKLPFTFELNERAEI